MTDRADHPQVWERQCLAVALSHVAEISRPSRRELPSQGTVPDGSRCPRAAWSPLLSFLPMRLNPSPVSPGQHECSTQSNYHSRKGLHVPAKILTGFAWTFNVDLPDSPIWGEDGRGMCLRNSLSLVFFPPGWQQGAVDLRHVPLLVIQGPHMCEGPLTSPKEPGNPPTQNPFS